MAGAYSCACNYRAQSGAIPWIPPSSPRSTTARPSTSPPPAAARGEPRTIEIVYHNVDGRIVISGQPSPRRRAWLYNIDADPAVTLHFKGPDAPAATSTATAREVTDPADRRHLLEAVARNWRPDGRRRDGGAQPADRGRRPRLPRPGLEVRAGLVVHRLRVTGRRPRVAARIRGAFPGVRLAGVDRVPAELALRRPIGPVRPFARLDRRRGGVRSRGRAACWTSSNVPRQRRRSPILAVGAAPPRAERPPGPCRRRSGQAGSASSRARRRASDPGIASPTRISASRPMKPRNGGVLISSSERDPGRGWPGRRERRPDVEADGPALAGQLQEPPAADSP